MTLGFTGGSETSSAAEVLRCVVGIRLSTFESMSLFARLSHALPQSFINQLTTQAHITRFQVSQPSKQQ